MTSLYSVVCVGKACTITFTILGPWLLLFIVAFVLFTVLRIFDW